MRIFGKSTSRRTEWLLVAVLVLHVLAGVAGQLEWGALAVALLRAAEMGGAALAIGTARVRARALADAVAEPTDKVGA